MGEPQDWFLGIIAFNALLQAVFLAGLVWALRQLNARLDQLQARVDTEVKPRLRGLWRKAADLADAAESARASIERLDRTMTARADQVGRLVDSTVGRLGATVEQTAAGVEQAGRAQGPVERWIAVARAVRRGIDVWRGFRPAAEDPAALD